MNKLDNHELNETQGGILPFVFAFGITYTLCSLMFSEDAHQGLNDGNGSSCK